MPTITNRQKDTSQEDFNKNIFDTYYSKVYKISYFIVRDNQLAEDATQETFIKIFKNIGSVKNLDKLEYWIYTIARNTAKQFYNRNKKVVSILPFDHFINTHRNTNQFDNPEQTYEYTELKQEIKKIISEMDSKYKEIFLLSFNLCLSYKEMAEVLDISESNVKVRLYRAKHFLIDKLERYLKVGEEAHISGK